MTYSRIVRSCLYYVRRTLCRHNFLQGPARARREAHTAPQSAAVGTGLPLRGKYPTTAVVLLPRTPRHQAPIGLAQHIGPPCTRRCMPTGQWGVLSFRVPARADCTLRCGGHWTYEPEGTTSRVHTHTLCINSTVTRAWRSLDVRTRRNNVMRPCHTLHNCTREPGAHNRSCQD